MPKERVVDLVEELTLPILEAQALELVDVEYKKEGGSWFLRVFIDKPDGIDIDDCSRVSEQLSERLDEVDPIPSAYFLEVSSPGAERPLKKPADFERAVGSYVHISLYQPLEGHKSFDGVLLSYGEDGAQLQVREKGIAKQVTIPVDAVASARLAIEF